jgi:hypothetical protein
MKTSNKLILTALILILVSLIVYDYLLKAEYASGKYNDPYNGFVPLNYKGFDVVDLTSSTAVNVKFVQGPFSVRIDKNALNYTKVMQQGNHLIIDASFERDYLYNPNPYTLVISCPKLNEVNTNATYRSNNRQVTDTIVRDDWRMRQVLIDGFKQDSLHIIQDYGSTVVLANNTFGWVEAIVGKSNSSGSKIIILASNQFGDAKFDIRNRSTFLLNNAAIKTLSYHLADSAKLVLSGTAQNLLNNPKTHEK